MANLSVASLKDLLEEGINVKLLEEIFEEFYCERDDDVQSFIRTKAISYDCQGFGRLRLSGTQQRFIKQRIS